MAENNTSKNVKESEVLFQFWKVSIFCSFTLTKCIWPNKTSLAHTFRLSVACRHNWAEYGRGWWEYCWASGLSNCWLLECGDVTKWGTAYCCNQIRGWRSNNFFCRLEWTPLDVWQSLAEGLVCLEPRTRNISWQDKKAVKMRMPVATRILDGIIEQWWP